MSSAPWEEVDITMAVQKCKPLWLLLQLKQNMLHLKHVVAGLLLMMKGIPSGWIMLSSGEARVPTGTLAGSYLFLLAKIQQNLTFSLPHNVKMGNTDAHVDVSSFSCLIFPKPIPPLPTGMSAGVSSGAPTGPLTISPGSTTIPTSSSIPLHVRQKTIPSRSARQMSQDFEMTEDQRKRQQEVLASAANYSDAAWDILLARLQANSDLSSTIFEVELL
ncbi:hypothetical protein Tco_0601761 [Tanacetum coccineum]